MKSRYFYRRVASPVHISKLIPQLEKGEAKLRQMSQEIGMTYQNLAQCMQDAHAEGLIDRQRTDNSWEFTLTDKGKCLAELCKGIKAVIEDWEGEKTKAMLRKLDFGNNEKTPQNAGVVKQAKGAKDERREQGTYKE